MKNTPVQLGYHELTICYGGPLGKPGTHSSSDMMAAFQFDANVDSLFPYVNAVAENAELYENPDLVRFRFNGATCVLYPEYCLISPITDREHARHFVGKLIDFLKDIAGRMETIKPKYKLFKNVSALDILKLLPLTNCRECGFDTCMAFAAILSRQQTIPSRCPYIGLPVLETVSLPVYGKDGAIESTLTLEVDTAKTAGDLAQQHEYIEHLEEELAVMSETRQQAGTDANKDLPAPLTDREIEVLQLLATGATNTEISEILAISTHTVKSHVIHIFNKLGVNDRTQAAVWAARHNLV
ncbi:MAG: LuxR C-terminal-related transcriptional regulator [Thermodesulfobacteriota bacterium]|nr:LuxR C-terminal-related transcriptional regulator [Thermodesulfobacteriota bacterium]